MQVKILEQTIECTNEVSAVENMFQQVNQLIAGSDLHLSHIKVDGIDVFEEHYQYVLNRLEEVKEITVVLKSLKELMSEVLLSAEVYLARLIPGIKQLSDKYYEGATQDSWVKFEQLLEGLQWILQMLDNVVNVENNLRYQNAEQYEELVEQLKEHVTNLQDAVDNEDMILLADILGYELLPSLEAIDQQIKDTFVDELVKEY